MIQMTHSDEVLRVLNEWGIPSEKILFSQAEKSFYNRKEKILETGDVWLCAPNGKPVGDIERYPLSLLCTNSEKLMAELKSRIMRSEKTIFYIQDNAPKFYPVIRSNVFELVKVAFIKKLS